MGLGKGMVHTPSRVGETNVKNRGFPWARGANSERTQVSKEQETFTQETWSKWASKQKSPKQALSRTDLQCRVFQTPTFSITESKMIFTNTNGKRKKEK